MRYKRDRMKKRILFLMGIFLSFSSVELFCFQTIKKYLNPSEKFDRDGAIQFIQSIKGGQGYSKADFKKLSDNDLREIIAAYLFAAQEQEREKIEKEQNEKMQELIALQEEYDRLMLEKNIEQEKEEGLQQVLKQKMVELEELQRKAFEQEEAAAHYRIDLQKIKEARPLYLEEVEQKIKTLH